MDVCEILKFVAENPRIPFYRFIFLYHENMEFRVFCGFFNEIFKKFQILFFPYMKLQLLINNIFIIFDNCAFKIQNSKKKLIFGRCHKLRGHPKKMSECQTKAGNQEVSSCQVVGMSSCQV